MSMKNQYQSCLWETGWHVFTTSTQCEMDHKITLDHETRFRLIGIEQGHDYWLIIDSYDQKGT